MPLQPSNSNEKKKQFLLANEKYFLRAVSIWFELTHDQLRKYKTILSWSSIVANHDIKWNADIVTEFSEYIFVANDENMQFNWNESLPWSIEFIEAYEDLWDWSYLAQNSFIINNLVIRNHFYNRLYPYIEEFGKSGLEEVKTPSQILIEDLEANIRILKKYKELRFQNVEEILQTTSINWKLASENAIITWSADLIEKFIDKWDWSALTINENIPWDLDLIIKFEDRIDWTVDITDNEGNRPISGVSISANPGVEWNSIMLSTFINKLDNLEISLSQYTKWDIDLLIQFQEFWDYDSLPFNRIVWDKVFSDFAMQGHLVPLLDLVLEKNMLKINQDF